MFLITTADERFWKTDEPILFLGEWCKRFSKRDIWERLNYEVLPYHWDDRKKMHQDYIYLDRLYEEILLILSERLNKIHNVNHTVRYWRIIIGRWLSCFVAVLYERYQSIKSAEESGKVTNTLIGRYEKGQWLPHSFPEYQGRWVQKDDYNYYLYSRIIEYTESIPFDVLKIKKDLNTPLENINNNKKNLFTLKGILKYFITLYENFIPRYFNQIAFVQTYLDNRDLIKLELSLGQFPYLDVPNIRTPKAEINWDLREKLTYPPGDNEFEKFLSEMIKEQTPTLYMEGYEEMNQISLNAYPSHPKVIFNAVSYSANESFKFWAAHHVDCGAKFVGTQYGGHYGAALCMQMEDHQIKIYDQYYTWGWKSKDCENIKPIPAAKLNSVKYNARPKKDGRLLMALSFTPRYFFQMASCHISALSVLDYFNDQYSFARALSKRNQKLLLVRLYRHDYGYDQIERFAYELPGIECYMGTKIFLEQLNESRLFIGTYNSTTYLEAFAANFPTILFWNPHYWELRPSAQPYFDELHRAGILYYSPESAAQKVNEIADEPMSWWGKPEIQAVKDTFCSQFARTSDRWLVEWNKELRNLKLEAEKMQRKQ